MTMTGIVVTLLALFVIGTVGAVRTRDGMHVASAIIAAIALALIVFHVFRP